MEQAVSGSSSPATPRRMGFFGALFAGRPYLIQIYFLISAATATLYFFTIPLLIPVANYFYFTNILKDVFARRMPRSSFDLPFPWVVIEVVALSAAIWVAGLLFTRVLAVVERWLVRRLLGAEIPHEDSQAPRALIGDPRVLAKDRHSWLFFVYMVLMVPLGWVYATLACIALVIPLSTIAAAVTGLITGEAHMHVEAVPWLDHLLHTAPGLLIVLLIGLLLFLIVLHLGRGIGWLHGKLARALLPPMH